MARSGDFPQRLKFDQNPVTTFTEEEDVRVTLLQGPDPDFRERVFMKVAATWNDKPINRHDLEALTPSALGRTMIDVLRGAVLPNSMEAITFDLLIEGLPLVEVTHLLRHRAFSAIHAQCTADRDLRDEKYFVPEAVRNNQTLREKYEEAIDVAVRAYAFLVDSKWVSMMDARYLLPRAAVSFYYVTANLKDLIMFVRHRRCTMIQPKVDNILARQIYEILTECVPEVGEVLSPYCDSTCAWVNSPDDRNSRLYEPDPVHRMLLEQKGKTSPPSIYGKTREEMGIS